MTERSTADIITALESEAQYFPGTGSDGLDYHGTLIVEAAARLRALEDDLHAARLALADAAREINCAGPVAERIRVLKRQHSDELRALEDEKAKLKEQRHTLHTELSMRDLRDSGGIHAAEISEPLQPDSGATCGLCGHPMPPGEEMFQYHGYSGPCPALSAPVPAPSEPPSPWVLCDFCGLPVVGLTAGPGGGMHNRCGDGPKE